MDPAIQTERPRAEQGAAFGGGCSAKALVARARTGWHVLLTVLSPAPRRALRLGRRPSAKPRHHETTMLTAFLPLKGCCQARGCRGDLHEVRLWEADLAGARFTIQLAPFPIAAGGRRRAADWPPSARVSPVDV